MAVSTIAKPVVSRVADVLVAPGGTGTISNVDVSEPRLLVCGHNSIPEICGIYRIFRTSVLPITAASDLTVSVSGTTVTIKNNRTTAGTTNCSLI